jgi:hypothetical protein
LTLFFFSAKLTYLHHEWFMKGVFNDNWRCGMPRRREREFFVDAYDQSIGSLWPAADIQ